MGVDIRIPIGLMFTILGGLLGIFGLVTSRRWSNVCQIAQYKRESFYRYWDAGIRHHNACFRMEAWKKEKCMTKYFFRP